MEEGGFKNYLKAENIKLKEDLEKLQNSLLEVTGKIVIFASGTTENKLILTQKIDALIEKANVELKIITPKIGADYAKKLITKAHSGTKIQIIINDRILLTKEEQKKGAFSKTFSKKSKTEDEGFDFAKIYDILKASSGIDLVNNPNVKFLLIITPEEAIFSAGWLERQILENTILLSVQLKDEVKIREIYDNYLLLLPSFMRNK